MGFFDFLSEVPYEASWDESQTTFDDHYAEPAIRRMNLRWNHVIEPFISEISGSRVLDLASHDGRWAHAFAAAGAEHVVGVEGRTELVERYSTFPHPEIKNRVELHVGDVIDFSRDLVKQGEQFDVVGVLGIFYHIMDHYGLLKMIHDLGPKLVIIDSEFRTQPWPLILLGQERTDVDINTTAYFAGQKMAPVGIPSQKALALMADTLDFGLEEIDWSDVSADDRKFVWDYFRPGQQRRFTYALRPKKERLFPKLRSGLVKLVGA